MRSADSVQCLLLPQLTWQRCRSQAAALTQQLRVGGTEQTFWPKKSTTGIASDRQIHSTVVWLLWTSPAAIVHKKGKPQTQEVASLTTHPHFTQHSGQNPVKATEVSRDIAEQQAVSGYKEAALKTYRPKPHHMPHHTTGIEPETEETDTGRMPPPWRIQGIFHDQGNTVH